jgi:peptide-methionine (S)-S-oxide reductase
MNVRSKLFALLPLFAFACCGPEQAGQDAIAGKVNEQPQTTQPKMTEDDNEHSKPQNNDAAVEAPKTDDPKTEAAEKQLATFGGGCFWCTEAVLEQLEGVLDVESGYTGGAVDNPTYEQICGGRTEHAEVVKVTFDPGLISYESLLDWFFRSHDPTTLNRQGNDVGTQYRSAIFFHSKEQHQTALRFMEKIANNWTDTIVTELTPAVKFWPAEKYHQDYFRNNQNQGYCRAIIKPKLAKLGLEDAPKK